MTEALSAKLRAALAVRMAEQRRRMDPLAHYAYASPVHRAVVRFLGQGIETHHRAANMGGKTQNGAAWVAAFLQQRGDLAGESVPMLGRAVVGAVLVASYEQQKDSSQKALRDWLGEWPHKEAMADAGRDIVSTLWVKPKDWLSDDYRTWSRVSFISQANSSPDAIKGQRWDFVWGDEPPVEAFWREARKNAPYLLITETPLDRAEWEWLQKDFDGPIGEPRGGRVELVSSLDDNRFLPDAKKQALRDRYRNDPHLKARLFGEYVDVTGDCPFPLGPLQRLLEWAEPGVEADFDPRVETWRDLDPSERYMVLLDPSAGIRPNADGVGGDACGMWVVAVRARAGVARFYGHIPPAELARMGLKAARYYNTALIVPEVNGLGEAMLPVFEGYRNVYREYALERADMALSGRVGWYQSEQTKSASIGALITALADGWFDIPSAEAVRSLMAIKRDDRGRLLRRPHQNHEDMILLGMAAYLLQHPSYAAPVVRTPAEMSPGERFEAALESDLGRKVRLRRRPLEVRDAWR